jgi:hypothetical protein
MLPASPSCPSASRPQLGVSTLTFRVYFWQARAWVPVGHGNVNVDDRLCACRHASHPFGRHVYRLFYHLLSRALWNLGNGPCRGRGLFLGLYLGLGLCGDRGLYRRCTLKC